MMKIGNWKITVSDLSFILTSGVPVDVVEHMSLQECPLSLSTI